MSEGRYGVQNLTISFSGSAVDAFNTAYSEEVEFTATASADVVAQHLMSDELSETGSVTDSAGSTATLGVSIDEGVIADLSLATQQSAVESLSVAATALVAYFDSATGTPASGEAPFLSGAAPQPFSSGLATQMLVSSDAAQSFTSGLAA